VNPPHARTARSGPRARRPAPPAHFLGLEGAAILPTSHFLLTHRAVEDVVDRAAMGVIHGDAGLGKTFAVQAALTAHPDWAIATMSFPNQPTMRQVAATLLLDTAGVPDPGYNRFRTTALLLEELGRVPWLIVVDEAQRLNGVCIEYLRHLHDHPTTRFALLLVGGNGCWEVLSREPMLESRVWRRVEFRALTAAEVLRHLRGYHRLYATVPDELLLFIDDNFAHGNFRNWASFTRTAADLLGRRNQYGLDEAVARNVFALYGGGADAR
jgi:DNA transposition AAA+ family ATPase